MSQDLATSEKINLISKCQIFISKDLISNDIWLHVVWVRVLFWKEKRGDNPLVSFTHRIASFGVNMPSYTFFAPENLYEMTTPSRWLASKWSYMLWLNPSFPHTLHTKANPRPLPRLFWPFSIIDLTFLSSSIKFTDKFPGTERLELAGSANILFSSGFAWFCIVCDHFNKPEVPFLVAFAFFGTLRCLVPWAHRISWARAHGVAC